jgi:hypothetical protein
VTILASGFGCVVDTMLFNYLGLPFGTTRPLIHDLLPLVDRVQRRLNASSALLAYGGRLQQIQSYLSYMPISSFVLKLLGSIYGERSREKIRPSDL